MPVRSLNSPVFKWPDAPTVDKAVRVWALDLVRQRSDVLRIAYFGSYARGDWGVGSDVDLLIILEQSKRPFWQRSLDFAAPHLPVPAQLLVYTAKEWQTLEEQRTRFYLTAEKEAVWVCG